MRVALVVLLGFAVGAGAQMSQVPKAVPLPRPVPSLHPMEAGLCRRGWIEFSILFADRTRILVISAVITRRYLAPGDSQSDKVSRSCSNSFRLFAIAVGRSYVSSSIETSSELL